MPIDKLTKWRVRDTEGINNIYLNNNVIDASGADGYEINPSDMGLDENGKTI